MSHFLKTLDTYLFNFLDGGPYYIETSPFICRANQLTGFYMIRTSVMKEFNMLNLFYIHRLYSESTWATQTGNQSRETRRCSSYWSYMCSKRVSLPRTVEISSAAIRWVFSNDGSVVIVTDCTIQVWKIGVGRRPESVTPNYPRWLYFEYSMVLCSIGGDCYKKIGY